MPDGTFAETIIFSDPPKKKPMNNILEKKNADGDWTNLLSVKFGLIGYFYSQLSQLTTARGDARGYIKHVSPPHGKPERIVVALRSCKNIFSAEKSPQCRTLFFF